MARGLTFGIDIGATKIQFVVALFSSQSARVQTHWSIATPKTRKGLYAVLTQELFRAKNIAHKNFRRIGIGLPGPLTPDNTRVVAAQNTPQIKGLTSSSLSRILGAKILFENDARVFALAEARFGAGKNYNRVLGITVGTGVGGGLVQNGKLERGAHGSAGEIGNMVIDIGGLPCTCGGRGHLESYVAHRAFLRLARKDPKVLEAQARKGNASAKRTFTKVGEYLGKGIASAVNLWDPDIVVVGGGIAQSGELLLRPARPSAKRELVSPLAKKRLKIVRAKFGRLSGAIGAALLSVL